MRLTAACGAAACGGDAAWKFCLLALQCARSSANWNYNLCNTCSPRPTPSLRSRVSTRKRCELARRLDSSRIFTIAVNFILLSRHWNFNAIMTRLKRQFYSDVFIWTLRNYERLILYLCSLKILKPFRILHSIFYDSAHTMIKLVKENTVSTKMKSVR